MPVSRHEMPFVARTPLQRASADGDAQEVITQLLRAAHDRGLERALLQADGVYSLTPLVWTALMGHSNIAQLLLTHMPERQVLQPASFGYTALVVAAKLGNAALCRQLLKFKPEQQLMHAIERTECPCCSDYDNAIALVFAAGHGHTEVVKALLTCIPERQVLYQTCKRISALYMAISSGSADIVELLLQHAPAQQVRMQHGRGFVALHLAASRGHERIVQQLLAAHDPAQQVLHVNEFGTMPIHLAAGIGISCIVDQLLAHSPEQQLAHKDANGNTAMLCATACNHVNVMPLLLNRASELCEPVQLVQQCNNKRYTPLMVAAEQGCETAVRFLLWSIPDWQVQQVNKNGCNALVLAVMATQDSCGLEVARLLLRHSPEVQVQQVSHYGLSALAFAMTKDRLDITQELLKHCPAKQLTAGRSIEDSLLCVAVAMAKVDFVQVMARHITDRAVLALGLMGATAVTSPSSNAATSAAFAKAQLRCCQLLLAAGADPTTLTSEQLSAFDRAQPEVQKLVREACRRRRKGQRPVQDEQSKAKAQQAEARAEQAAAALLAEEEADRAKAQAAQVKKDKKKQKKAAAKAQKSATQADTAGQEDTTGAVEAEEGEVAAATSLSAAGPSAGSGSGGSWANVNGGGDSSRGGGSDDVGSSRSASSSKGGNASVLVQTVKGPDTCALPVTQGAQASSSCEDDRWCVVCLERRSCRALVPCGHIVMCGPCCEAVQASKNECPMCREGILAVLAINTANL